MTTGTAGTGDALATAAPGERGRRRRVVAAVLALIVAAGVVVVVTDPFSNGGGSPGGVSDNGYATSTASVVRESISQQTQVSATLGYAGDLTIRLAAGNAPAAVTQAQQTVTTAQGMLAGAQSTLQSDASVLSAARATLAADRQQESLACAGNSSAQSPASGGGSSGASGGCATDAQSVAGGTQSVTADAAKVSADQTQMSSAEQSLAAARAALASADAQATVYGQNSIFTSVPSAGEIVRRGRNLFSIDGEPAMLLLYGPAVATRAFAAGMSPGKDVAALNANLEALGYAHALTGDAFTAATAAAIGRLQTAHGEPQTGALPLGSVVFEPGPIRVTSVMPTVAVGAGVMAGPVLSATWVTRQVSIQLDAGLEGQVKVGDPVSITLPDNQTTPGRISYVSSVASTGQNGSTIAVDAVPTDPATTGSLDQAPVNVSITTASVSNVLVVPVDALLALANGGYAVEVIGAGNKHSLVTVTTGLFDDADGLVQVTASGLAVGQHVVVPGG